MGTTGLIQTKNFVSGAASGFMLNGKTGQIECNNLVANSGIVDNIKSADFDDGGNDWPLKGYQIKYGKIKAYNSEFYSLRIKQAQLFGYVYNEYAPQTLMCWFISGKKIGKIHWNEMEDDTGDKKPVYMVSQNTNSLTVFLKFFKIESPYIRVKTYILPAQGGASDVEEKVYQWSKDGFFPFFEYEYSYAIAIPVGSSANSYYTEVYMGGPAV